MNQLLDAFIDSTKVTKSHILVANIPMMIEIPTGKLQCSMTNEPKPRLKRGRPISSKGTIPRKMKRAISMTPEEHITVKPHVNEQVALVEAPVKELSLNDVSVHNNEEIYINYIHEGRIWDRNTTHINNAFSFQVAMDIIRNDEDQEPQGFSQRPGIDYEETYSPCNGRNHIHIISYMNVQILICSRDISYNFRLEACVWNVQA